MRQSVWTRFRWGVLFVGVIFCMACVAQVEPVERRAAYTGGSPRIVAPLPYPSPFGDIPIPGELHEVSGHSTVMEAGGEKTGFIHYSGRVTKPSLEIFFKGELKKNGWELVTAFTSEPSTVLLFNRGALWCVVVMDGRGPATDVRIGVSQDLGLAPRLLGH